MNTTIFDKIIKAKDFSIEPITNGLTNLNYLIKANAQQYVLRITKKDSDLFVSRKPEYQALQLLASQPWSYKVLYYDQTSGTLISEWIKDSTTYDLYTGSNKITMVAELMLNFHNMNQQISDDFNPVARFNHYFTQLTSFKYPIHQHLDILDEAANLEYKSCLCHNDWVSGNIICTNKKAYLIDFEYAGNNDPVFDVMSFITENNIIDTRLRKLFYQSYFKEMNESIYHRIAVWEKFHNLLWCTWALLMHQMRHEQIYLDIADDKWNALQKNIKNKS